MANRVILSGPKSASVAGGAAADQPLIGEVTAVSAAAPVPTILDGKTAAKITVTATAPILANFGANDTLFAGVEAMLTYPGKTSDQGWQRPAGIAAATPFSFDLILPYPNSIESWIIYLRARSEKYINALILTGPNTTPNVTVNMAPLSLILAPDVALFGAGQNNGDGTFAANMYWDSMRKNMLVDWACLAPVDRSNWSGVQIWVQTPDGAGGFNYFAATGIIGIDAFISINSDFVHNDTISVEPTSIPVPPQSWNFIAVSAANDINQTINRAATLVTGPIVSLTTLPKADFVTGFAANLAVEWSKDGAELYRVYGSWVNPNPPRYKGILVVMRMPSGDVPLAKELEGSTSFRADAFAVPEITPVNITIYFVPIFGDNIAPLIIFGITPSVDLVITRHGVAPPVSFTVSYVYQKIEATGQIILKITPDFIAPVIVNYGWTDFWALREDNIWSLLGSPNQGGIGATAIITNPPSVIFLWKFLLISKDINNKDSNGDVKSNPNFPPSGSLTFSININPPKIDSPLGQVTGWSVSYSYSAPDANGRQSLSLVPIFIPPADFAWSYIEFWAKREDGLAYLLGYPSSSGAASAAIIESLPATAATWSFWPISFDSNDLNSDGKRSSNPLLGVPTGTPAPFSLSVYPPGVIGSVLGVEKTSNIAFDTSFNGGVNPSTSFSNRADGTVQYQVWAKLILPISDLTWGGYDVITLLEDNNGTLIAGAVKVPRLAALKTVDAIFLINIPTSIVRLAVFFISYDVNNRQNTLNTSEMAAGGTLTPRKDITVGSISGIADLSKALSSTLGPAIGLLNSKLDVALLGVDTSRLGIGAVNRSKLQALIVSANEVADFTLTSQKYSALSVNTAAIAYLAVGTQQVQDAAIVNAKIQDLQATKITTGALMFGVSYSGAVNTNQLNAGTISAAITLTAPTIVVSGGSAIININTTDLIKVQDGAGFGAFVQVTGRSVIVSPASSGDKTILGMSGLSCRGSLYDNLNVSFLKLFPYGSGSVNFAIDTSSAYTSGSASAGISGSLPSNPASFLIVTINNSQFKIPFYNM